MGYSHHGEFEDVVYLLIIALVAVVIGWIAFKVVAVVIEPLCKLFLFAVGGAVSVVVYAYIQMELFQRRTGRRRRGTELLMIISIFFSAAVGHACLQLLLYLLRIILFGIKAIDLFQFVVKFLTTGVVMILVAFFNNPNPSMTLLMVLIAGTLTLFAASTMFSRSSDRRTRLNSNIKYAYHQTSPSIAKIIMKDKQMLRGSRGLAGGGIYFATNKRDTLRKAHEFGAVITARVKLGRIKKISYRGDYNICFSSLCREGYDSVEIPRPGGTEWVVYNFDQVEVVCVDYITSWKIIDYFPLITYMCVVTFFELHIYIY